ncbi:MAG: hypothetical protein PHW72_03850 [Candidatus Pacebacteria bacterium]|nr:hypothetical protein [Candidatus Paceibacterota bacterium]
MQFVNSKNEAYMEQLCRIRRLYGILGNFDFSINNISENNLTRVDMLLCFFTNCYHLRDWLKESGIIENKKLNNFIEKSYELSICRNICLGAKHLNVKKPSNPQMYKGVNTPIGISFDCWENREKLTVSVDGREIDCIDLAEKCLDQWEDFIKKNVK